MESTVTSDPKLTRPYVLGLLPPRQPFLWCSDIHSFDAAEVPIVVN